MNPTPHPKPYSLVYSIVYSIVVGIVFGIVWYSICSYEPVLRASHTRDPVVRLQARPPEDPQKVFGTGWGVQAKQGRGGLSGGS